MAHIKSSKPGGINNANVANSSQLFLELQQQEIMTLI